jgi:DNA-directed RNA polymerase specialized sigma24 family protein
MDLNTDADLVRMARAGNRGACDGLIRRYQRQVRGLACLLLDDQFEAEDATQEAFLRAWLNLDLLSDPGKFAAWLRRIVFGVCIDWLRVFRPNLYRLSDSRPNSSCPNYPPRPHLLLRGSRALNYSNGSGTPLRACHQSTGYR